MAAALLIMSCACNDEAFDHETLDPIWRLAGTIAIFWGQIIQPCAMQTEIQDFDFVQKSKIIFCLLKMIIKVKKCSWLATSIWFS